MYETYLWKIKPLSSYLTPWQSDTVYGHMLWGLALVFGEKEVKSAISEFKLGNPPFIVSDGFIDGNMPFLKKDNLSREDSKELSQKLNISLGEIIKSRKVINKIKYLNLDEFNMLRGDYTIYDYTLDKLKNIKNLNLTEEKKVIENIVMHNVINRTSNSTTDDGLYFTREIFTNKDIYIFMKVRKDYPIEKIKETLKFIESNGYGKRVGSGKGDFKTISFEKFNGFTEIKDGNAFVVLSNYIPKENDYEEVIYSNHIVKFAKVANLSKYSDIPFKKPFSCFIQGSIFRKGKNSIVGKVLENIHVDTDVVQIGIPFILEVKI